MDAEEILCNMTNTYSVNRQTVDFGQVRKTVTGSMQINQKREHACIAYIVLMVLRCVMHTTELSRVAGLLQSLRFGRWFDSFHL